VAIADEYSDGAEPRPERQTFDPRRAQQAGCGIARTGGGWGLLELPQDYGKSGFVPCASGSDERAPARVIEVRARCSQGD